MIRIGVIGSGFGAAGLAPAFRTIDGCEVVVSSNPRSAWREFLEREELAAVAIAVPPQAQHAIAMAAIERGLHVFAEKPLAADLTGARELLAFAQKKKVVHCVDFMFPEIAQWRKVKELLDTEALGACRNVAVDWTWLSGDLRHNRSTWRTDVAQGGGALSMYFSHGFHYLEHFLGEIVDVASLFTYSPRSANGGEVGADMLLQFQSGATGTVHVSCNSPGHVGHRLVFQCERGVIVLGNHDAVVDNFHVHVLSEDGGREIAVDVDRGSPPEDERVKIVRRVAERFVQACTATNGIAGPSFEHGVRVNELIRQARESVIR